MSLRPCMSPICLLILTVTSSPLTAQVPYDGCTNRQGRPIVGIVSDSLPHAGWATVQRDGTPVIYWNPKRQYSPQGVTQVFLYLHECAHHALGHVYRWPESLDETKLFERQADCWSYQLLVDGGMLTGNRREILEGDLRYTTGDAAHLGGEALLASLRDCLAARTDRRQWHAVLTGLELAARDSFQTFRRRPLAEDPTVSEATIHLPGTFDCEIRVNGSYVCLIFAARDDRRVDRRFQQVSDLVRSWLGPAWTSNTIEAPAAGQRRIFMAERADDGVRILLLATEDRKLWFIMKPAV
jgi:hypothetical protein